MPLFVNLLYSNLQLAKLLLSHKADPIIPGESDRPSLYLAIARDEAC